MKNILYSALLLFPLLASAANQPAPIQPILTFDGQVDAHYQGKTIDIAELEKLHAVTLKTTTQWEKTPQTWTGVELQTLLQTIGAKGTKVHIACLNDYAVDIPLAEINKYHPILAYEKNGNLMPVRQKGPLIVIWPYDQKPEINIQQKYHNWAAWQVKAISVE